MGLLDLRQSICESLRLNVSELRATYAHGGHFDLAEFQRTAVATPCAIVACLGVNSTELQGSLPVASAQWGIFIVCKGTSQDRRDAQALALAEMLIREVYANAWRTHATSRPLDVTARDESRDEFDQKGVAVWRIEWTQSVDLTTDTSQLTPFMGIDSTWDMFDSAHHPDATDYTQLEGDRS